MASSCRSLREPLFAALPPPPAGGASGTRDSDDSGGERGAGARPAGGGVRAQPVRRARPGRARRFIVRRRGWAFVAFDGALERRLRRLLVRAHRRLSCGGLWGVTLG
jgi:hypothetical protein